ncbi:MULTISPECIES: hypothetical protein [unclassified Anaeromyxobacter]|uniref:hypothetical protein n=1 Tax=unclassified Anaeromyxobacter TaxID=2620896 RepID=UPI001F5A3E15|nr:MULTISPECIES: hypothetical protein [unclassified Anaeromyxobacter]
MKRLLLAGAAALLSAMPALAQTAPVRYVFVAVDAVEIRSTTIKVTGVVDGESAPQTVTMTLSSSSGVDSVAACERLALLAMTRPGQFLFEIQGSTTYNLNVCKLARATP